VVAVVPWERPGLGAIGRLWATARASTFDAERFFESLPDGPLGPALTFAIASELVATTSMAIALAVPVALLAPSWAHHVMVDDFAVAVRLTATGIPLVAGLLVIAHAAHGWALDLGARRSGARGAATRALRFGLYASGWDLVIGPLGAIVVTFKQGVGAAISIAAMTSGLPSRSALSFLRGCYGLHGDAARPALRASYVAAGASALVAALAVVAAFIAVLMG